MKLHHRVLSTLAACAAANMAIAENVAWDYSSNTTFNYAGDNVPTIPTEATDTITKTGGGTVILDLGKNGATGAECDATASTFAGNVTIEGGAIKIGDANGSTGTAWRISPDVLGTEGTIHVKTGAELQLEITQNGSVTFNKAISLDGGKLHIQDGNYTFAKPLTLTADATIQNDWDKSHTFNGINAEGKKLTITRGSGGNTTMTFKGAVNVGSIEAGNGVNLVFNKDNNGLQSLTTGGITMGTNSRLDLHVTQNGTTNLGAITMGGENTIHMIDGHYTAATLTLKGDTTINSDWNKKFKAEQLEATGHTLTFFGSENPYGQAILEIGDGTVGTLNINGKSELNVTGVLTSESIYVNNVSTITGATLSGVSISRNSKTISGGTITGGSINITADTVTINNVTLDGTTLNLSNVTTFNGSGISMNGGTITLANLGATTFGTDVTSSVLSGISLTGSLDLNFSSDLVATYASETPFAITFSGLNSTEATGITVSQEMLDNFGALTVTQGENTVLSFAGTGTSAVPEPATATLSLLALAGLAARRRRK